jgi:hAT family C-terminal dimerisation region
MTRPVFVPMQPLVELKIDELQKELDDIFPHSPHPPGEAAAAAPPPVEIKKQEQGPPPAKRFCSAGRPPIPSALPTPNIDMDAGVDIKQEEEDEKGHDVGWELQRWFGGPGGSGLSWKTDPTSAWSALEQRFPLLSLLARRFLCILPTSASSERARSGFGHIIGPHSTTIDSVRAAQMMFLRYNHDLVDRVPCV